MRPKPPLKQSIIGTESLSLQGTSKNQAPSSLIANSNSITRGSQNEKLMNSRLQSNKNVKLEDVLKAGTGLPALKASSSR